MTTARVDRRGAVKTRHRTAILDAADALIGERGSPQFSVDELAQRADVARRTVFNHFASLDDVVMAACTRVLTGAVEEVRVVTAATPVGDGSPAALFTELTTAMRGVDLPSVVAYIGGVFDDRADARSHHLVQDVFTRCTDDMAAEMTARSASDDGLEAQIMVSSMVNGLAVVAGRWMDETGGALDPASRATWDALLDRLVTAVRSGYAATT